MTLRMQGRALRRARLLLPALALLFALDSTVAWGQPDVREQRRQWRERYTHATPAEQERMRHALRERIRNGVQDRVHERLEQLPPQERRELRRRWRQAGPEEREQLRREIVRRTLTEEERARLREFVERAGGPVPREELAALGRDLGGLSPQERRRVRRQIRELPQEERQVLMERLSRYRSLPGDEQLALRDQLSRMRSMDADERRRLDDNARRFRELPESERQRMRDLWRRLQEMPEAEREALLQKLAPE